MRERAEQRVDPSLSFHLSFYHWNLVVVVCLLTAHVRLEPSKISLTANHPGHILVCFDFYFPVTR